MVIEINMLYKYLYLSYLRGAEVLNTCMDLNDLHIVMFFFE